MARAIRAHCLASGQSPADIALIIHSQCGPAFGTTLVRAHRLAQGIALADVVAQVRARYVSEGRTPPRFSETLLSSYEGGQKRPGPEYLHYLCCVYQAEPADLGYEGPCLCRQGHRAPVLMLSGPAAPPRRNRATRRPRGRAATICPGADRRPADTHRSPVPGRRGGPAEPGNRPRARSPGPGRARPHAIACAGVASGPARGRPRRPRLSPRLGRRAAGPGLPAPAPSAFTASALAHQLAPALAASPRPAVPGPGCWAARGWAA